MIFRESGMFHVKHSGLTYHPRGGFYAKNFEYWL